MANTNIKVGSSIGNMVSTRMETDPRVVEVSETLPGEVEMPKTSHGIIEVPWLLRLFEERLGVIHNIKG